MSENQLVVSQVFFFVRFLLCPIQLAVSIGVGIWIVFKIPILPLLWGLVEEGGNDREGQGEGDNDERNRNHHGREG